MARLSGIHQPDPTSYTARMGSESVTVTFDAALMTGRWEQAVRRAIDESDGDRTASLLFSVFTAWDVVDDNDQPVPISEDILLGLPSKALAALFDGMREATGPTSAEGNASATISSTANTDSTPPQATPLNGPPPSPSQTPSESLLQR